MRRAWLPLAMLVGCGPVVIHTPDGSRLRQNPTFPGEGEGEGEGFFPPPPPPPPPPPIDPTPPGCGVWAVEVVADNAGPRPDVDAAIDAVGRHHVVFTRDDDQVVYAVDGANGFTELVVEDGARDTWGPSIAVDEGGVAHLAWTRRDLGETRYARVEGGGVAAVETVDERVAFHTDIAVDADGRPRVAYFDDIAQGVFVATPEDGAWAATMVDATAIDRGVRVAVDVVDAVHVAYVNETSVRHATEIEDGAFVIEEADGPGADPGLALDGGIVHLSYGGPFGVLVHAERDGMNWQRRQHQADPSATDVAVAGGVVHVVGAASTGEMRYFRREDDTWIRESIPIVPSPFTTRRTVRAIDDEVFTFVGTESGLVLRAIRPPCE